MKVYIMWNYKHSKKTECTFQSDYLDAEDAITIADDLERTGRAASILFYDELGEQWNRKELKKMLAEIEDEPQDVQVFFDGGYLKEERLAGLGIAIYYTKNKKRHRLRSNRLVEEMTSSNEAEYAALYEAIRLLEELGVHHQVCTFSGDSHVVLNQLAGEWASFDELFNRWMDRIEEKLARLGITPRYEPVSRKENSEADMLANKALEGTEIVSELMLEED